ncbi:MAG: hypothetical protein RL238_48 [Actinomycetota bacterium]
MDLGLLTLGDHLRDPITDQLQTQAERHRRLVDQAVLAEQVGFRSVHLGEHHFCDYILSAPPIVLAAIAERTTHLRLSTGVTLGANLDPLRVAEDYATVDLLSGGRVEPVLGRGTFFPHTYHALGQDPKHSKAMFADHLELLLKVWTDECVTWSGEHHPPLDGITVQPRPLQQPRPPIWVGAGTSPDSIELAARLGLWLMLPTVFGTPELFRPTVELYEERWEAYGHDPADRRIGCCSHAWVDRDSARARERWEPRYRTYVEWVNELFRISTGLPDGQGMGGFDFDERCRTIALCGSPAQVVDRMEEIRDVLHLDTYLLMFDMGGMPWDELAPTIELVGSDVMPALRP